MPIRIYIDRPLLVQNRTRRNAKKFITAQALLTNLPGIADKVTRIFQNLHKAWQDAERAGHKCAVANPEILHRLPSQPITTGESCLEQTLSGFEYWFIEKLVLVLQAL